MAVFQVVVQEVNTYYAEVEAETSTMAVEAVERWVETEGLGHYWLVSRDVKVLPEPERIEA